MNGKTISILLLSVLWFWLCDYWYTCKIKQVCYGCGETAAATASAGAATTPAIANMDNKGPLYYKWSENNAFTNSDKFPGYKTSLLKGKTEDNLLIISAPYYKDEPKPEGYENMGLARAAEIRKLFTEIPKERIRLEGKLVGDNYADKENSFEGTSFRWEAIKREKAEVVELEEKSIILFPFNASVKEPDPTVDTYLEKVAKKIKSSGEKIELVGHTDNVGEEKYNKNLGLKRAKYIRDILVKKGVKKNLISVASKGESEPVATNNTEEGKQSNRRVVLTVTK